MEKRKFKFKKKMEINDSEPLRRQILGPHEKESIKEVERSVH